MARPRAATYDTQREQILAAAARAFALRGYTATTMNDIAAASRVSKATLYHYVSDKQALLEQITRGHVARLQALLDRIRAEKLPADEHLRQLVLRFMRVYADSQHEHRVLTEDVKFLAPPARADVTGAQRRVVQAFADAVATLRPDLAGTLHKPLAMLLFGMINWTFIWLKAGGALSHASLAPVVAELFFHGLHGMRGGLAPAAPAAPAAPRKRRPQGPPVKPKERLSSLS